MSTKIFILILATVVSLANSATFSIQNDLIDITVKIGDTTTTVIVVTDTPNAFGFGFGGTTMADTYAVIHGFDPATAPQTEVITAQLPRACHPILAATTGVAVRNWESEETNFRGIRTIVFTRANTVDADECPTCFQFNPDSNRMSMIWAIYQDNVEFAHTRTTRGGERLIAIADLTSDPTGDPTSDPTADPTRDPTTTTPAPVTPAPVTPSPTRRPRTPAPTTPVPTRRNRTPAPVTPAPEPTTNFGTSTDQMDISIAVGATTTTVTIKTDSLNAVGVGFGGIDMDNTYAVIVGWDTATAPQTEVLTVQRPRGCHEILLASGAPVANWESTETIEGGTRTIVLTRATTVDATECPTCFQFNPDNARLNIIYAIYFDDISAGHSFRGGERLTEIPSATTTPAPTRRRRKGAAAKKGPGRMITTASPTRRKYRVRNTKSPPTTAEPTPYPTEACDCYDTQLVSRTVDRFGNRCYRYQFAFCNDEVNSVVLGAGKPALCTTDFSGKVVDVQSNTMSGSFSYDLNYFPVSDAPARGIKLDGLLSGDTVRICFDASVYGVLNGGNVEYQTDSMEYVCQTPATLPDVCPNDGGPVAAGKGGGRMITTTTTAAPRKTPRTTKAARTKTTRLRTKTTKTPRVRTKTTRARTKGKGTPSPTPMPTEECDCYTTNLVGRQVIGSNKCYKYEVDFCKPGMNSIILGDGNADTECGIMDMMDIITNVRVPDSVTYETTYDDKVRGLKIDGLMSGDKFRVCFDKDLVDGVMKGGFIEYQSYYGDVSCKQSGTLPELCPLVVSNAKMPKYRTPSPTPNPTKGVRVKTTRARMKTTRMRTKTTRARAKTTRARTKTGKTPQPTTAEPTPYPTPFPTEQCECVSTTLISRNVVGSNKCYRYEVDFCNDEVNSITLGDGNADAECGVDFMAVLTEVDLPDDVTYAAVYNDKVRGLRINGLMSGDRFRVCYDKNVVDSTIKAGFIEYHTDSGDFSCKQYHNLPNLCPTVVSNAKSPGGKGPVDPCSCNTVTLLGTPYSNGDSCYRYQVNFCNDNYDTIEMDMGNPEGLCDTKIKQVFTSYKPPSLNIQVGRPFGGDEPKARGISISDLSDGDMFTLCFDSSAVYNVRQYGTIDFLNARGIEENCPVTDVLFDLCPTVDPPFAGMGYLGNTMGNMTVMPPPFPPPHHKGPGGLLPPHLYPPTTTSGTTTKAPRTRMKTTRARNRMKTTRSKNPMKTTRAKTPTKTTRSRNRVKTTRARTKTTRLRTKTTRMRTKTPQTPMPTTPAPTTTFEPTPQPTDMCDCYSTTLTSRQVIGSNRCYRYRVNFCNDGVNSVILGKGQSRRDCRVIDIAEVGSVLRKPDYVAVDTDYKGGSTHKVRGLKLDGLMNGDSFRVCFDKDAVEGVMTGGNIAYETDDGDAVCPADGILFDLCGGSSAAMSVGVEGNDVVHVVSPGDNDGKDTIPNMEEPTMIYLWSALCSALVAMTAVFIVYTLCIKNDTQSYDKVVEFDEDEETEDEEEV